MRSWLSAPLTFTEKNMQKVTIHHGDCLELLAELAEASVDALITDPPYSLGFLGREWDSHNGTVFHARKEVD